MTDRIAAVGPRLRRADLVLALVLCACGVAALISISRMRAGAAAFQPRLFPTIVAVLLLLIGVALALRARRAPFPSVQWPPRERANRIGVMLGSLSAQVLLIDLIGMPLATFIAVTFQVWYLGEYRWRVPVLAGLVAAVLVYAVFIYGLGLTLPTGPFHD